MSSYKTPSFFGSPNPTRLRGNSDPALARPISPEFIPEAPGAIPIPTRQSSQEQGNELTPSRPVPKPRCPKEFDGHGPSIIRRNSEQQSKNNLPLGPGRNVAGSLDATMGSSRSADFSPLPQNQPSMELIEPSTLTKLNKL